MSNIKWSIQALYLLCANISYLTTVLCVNISYFNYLMISPKPSVQTFFLFLVLELAIKPGVNAKLVPPHVHLMETSSVPMPDVLGTSASSSMQVAAGATDNLEPAASSGATGLWSNNSRTPLPWRWIGSSSQ